MMYLPRICLQYFVTSAVEMPFHSSYPSCLESSRSILCNNTSKSASLRSWATVNPILCWKKSMLQISFVQRASSVDIMLLHFCIGLNGVELLSLAKISSTSSSVQSSKQKILMRHPKISSFKSSASSSNERLARSNSKPSTVHGGVAE